MRCYNDGVGNVEERDVVITILWIKLQLRVDLTGDQTQKVFDRILTNLGRTAPPVPGFRMQKGGKKLHY